MTTEGDARTISRTNSAANLNDSERESLAQTVAVEKQQNLVEPLSWLPYWAKPRKVLQLAFEGSKKPQPLAVPLGVVAGQVIPVIVAATIGRWLFQISLAVLATRLAKCDNSMGTVSYDLSMWMVGLAAHFLIGFLEVHAFAFIAIPKFQILGIPQNFQWFPCCARLPFCMWFFMLYMLSLLATLDFTTDSLFLGVQMKAQSCVAGKLINAKWQSIYRAIPSFLLVPYWLGCFIAWVVNLVPVVFIMLYSVIGKIETWTWPCRDDRLDDHRKFTYEAPWSLGTKDLGRIEVDKSAGANQTLKKVNEEWVFKKDTIGAKEHNHGEALMGLAETNGMKLLVWGDLNFAETKANISFDDFIKASNFNPNHFGNADEDIPLLHAPTQRDAEDANPMNASEGSPHSQPRASRGESESHAAKLLNDTTGHISSQVRRGVLHLFFCGSLANGQQVLLQTTSLSMTTGSSDLQMRDWQVIGSLIISVLSLCFRLYSAREIYKVARNWQNKLNIALAKTIERSAGTEPGDDCIWRIRELGYWIKTLVVGCLACLLQLMLAGVKIISMDSCPHSTWCVFTGCWKPDSEYTLQCLSILNETATQQPQPFGFNNSTLYKRWCA